MIFDGDCKFCAVWIRRWKHATRDFVDYLPFQDGSVAARFPELPREQFEAAVQLIGPDGSVYSGAEAAFRALASNPHEQFLLDWYTHSPAFARTTECAYRFIARNRGFFSFFTRFLWGEHVEPPNHLVVRWVFLRALAIIYLIAFVSLWVQIKGLVGSNGILPVQTTMDSLRRATGESAMNHQAGFQAKPELKSGLARYHLAPTFCWLDASDNFLQIQCAAGSMLAILLLAGVAPAPCLFLLWLIYLSLCTVCREFLGFQWDILLLETGFLAIFFAPLQMLPRLWRTASPSRIVLWLIRLLLFKLMFQSGCVKLLSHDVTWRNFTALSFHYKTQPLPTWVGWYAHQLPASAQKVSTLLMFAVELAIPFLIFAPRRLRFFAGFAFVALQVMILLTGNYCFFNLLTIALCVSLLDDAALARFVPKQWRTTPGTDNQALSFKRSRWPLIITVPLACGVVVFSLMQFSGMFRVPLPWPRPLAALYAWSSPFRSFNSYGLFAVMTTSRPEIVVEGSNDGVTWLEYEFKYKAGDVKRRPRFVEPHQPRLDWQMWFAALGDYRQNPWFLSFCLRLLQGSPEVLGLIQHNPFPNEPPRFLRAVVYEYHFTDLATRRKTGAWWRRELKGDYIPVITIRQNE